MQSKINVNINSNPRYPTSYKEFLKDFVNRITNFDKSVERSNHGKQRLATEEELVVDASNYVFQINIPERQNEKSGVGDVASQLHQMIMRPSLRATPPPPVTPLYFALPKPIPPLNIAPPNLGPYLYAAPHGHTSSLYVAPPTPALRLNATYPCHGFAPRFHSPVVSRVPLFVNNASKPQIRHISEPYVQINGDYFTPHCISSARNFQTVKNSLLTAQMKNELKPKSRNTFHSSKDQAKINMHASQEVKENQRDLSQVSEVNTLLTNKVFTVDLKFVPVSAETQHSSFPPKTQELCSSLTHQQLPSPTHQRIQSPPINCQQLSCSPINQQLLFPHVNQQIPSPLVNEQLLTHPLNEEVPSPPTNQQLPTSFGNEKLSSPSRDQRLPCPPMNQHILSSSMNQQITSPLLNDQIPYPPVSHQLSSTQETQRFSSSEYQTTGNNNVAYSVETAFEIDDDIQLLYQACRILETVEKMSVNDEIATENKSNLEGYPEQCTFSSGYCDTSSRAVQFQRQLLEFQGDCSHVPEGRRVHRKRRVKNIAKAEPMPDENNALPDKTKSEKSSFPHSACNSRNPPQRRSPKRLLTRKKLAKKIAQYVYSYSFTTKPVQQVREI